MANATGDGMRALKIATIAMGVLIVLGTTVILVTIVKRTMLGSPPGSGLTGSGLAGSGPRASGPAGSDAAVVGSAGSPEKPFAALLDEPVGTMIAGIAAVHDRLAVQLHGGGVDRVVLIDPVSGAVVGRVTLAR
jgi:hypothetical protein